ncbi:tetratricopeptide repeat protein [Adhaeretor mobilis]|uniref:TPR repeat-containing protein YrrB n=1 Tax=Adhaeretor mobilis TaxID=1930276 RepID=A0A517MQG6_9BACT|nr:tetratricopeptide repeat protein [Adhaeretor mobilis]QDS97130.1 TPR repeat-containing protein YrrB [Adhaeretor mobilis]
MSRFPLLLLLLALPLFAVGTSSVGQDADEETALDPSDANFLYAPEAVAAYEEGVRLAEAGENDQALAAFSAALQMQTDYKEAYVAKGKILLELEDYEAAKKAFRSAIDYDAQSAEAYNGSGEASLEMGTIDIAYNDFLKALDFDRQNAEVLSNIGHIEVNYQNDPVTGIRFLDDAIALNPEDARAHRDRGLAHARLQEFDDATTNLKKAAEIDPGDYENFSTLASIYLAEDKYAEAIEALGQAIEAYEPKKHADLDLFIEGYLQRADARMQLGFEEAETDKAASMAAYEAVIGDAKKILAEYPDRFPYSGLAHYNRGIAERMLGQYGEAIKSLTESIQSVPGGQQPSYLAPAYLRRGICWHYQDYDDLARGDFEQAASINFLDPVPHLWMGLSYANEGDYRKAIVKYNEAISKDPSYALAYVNRGRAYYQLKEYERAITSFNDAIRNEPTNAEHYYKRGICHMQIEEYKKAVNSFRSALLNDPNMAKAQRQMGEAQRKLGNPNLGETYETQAGQ